MDEIPIIYKSIIEDPVAVHDSFTKAAEMQIGDLIFNRNDFMEMLIKNFSLPSAELEAFLNSSLVPEKMILKFSMEMEYPLMPTSDLLTGQDPDLSVIVDSFTFNSIEHPSLEHLYDLLAYLERHKGKFKVVWGVIEKMFDSRLDVTVTNDDIGAIAEELKSIILSPSGLRELMCQKNGLPSVFKHENEVITNKSSELQIALCSMNQTTMNKLSKELQKYIDVEKLRETLHLDNWNITLAQQRLKKLSDDECKILFVGSKGNFPTSLPDDGEEIDLDKLGMSKYQQEQIDSRKFPEISIIPQLFHSLPLEEFAANTVIINKDVFLQQLDSIDNAACSWISLMSGLSLNMFQGFRTEEDLLDYFKHQAYFDNVTVLASVIFNMSEDGSMPNHMTYKIRQNASFTTTTNLVRSRFWFPGPRNWGYGYYQFGFVWIQDVLERAMISIYAGRDVTEPGSFIHQFPYPCYIQDQFLVSVVYSKAKLAASMCWNYILLTYVPYMYIAVREEAAHDHIPVWLKSLLSTTAFGLGAKYFAFYEEVGVGVQWFNIAISPVEDDEYSLLSVAIMMMIDATLYSIFSVVY
ncbi:ATP-binding cassette sub-family A member 2 [Caerostris extrusa]|uniref:ATP-binding cassette sub-family A member 2 n=1 Tax=Caerostris extrusa TaxID=172846 RepID=A0AAV4WYJ2_CAEEX|nr:ATP-binding cassette sub-family A member 2 [Caerostris extrusa]